MCVSKNLRILLVRGSDREGEFIPNSLQHTRRISFSANNMLDPARTTKLVMHQIRKERGKKGTEAYIALLEENLAMLTEGIVNLYNQQREMIDLQTQAIKNMPVVATGFRDMAKRLGGLEKENLSLKSFLDKFKGRKVSPDNEEVYKEIRKADKERIELGQDSNYRQSAKIVFKNRRIHGKRADQMYKNFIEWKNSQNNK